MQDYPAFERPRRPALIELGAATLIVGGAAQLLLRVGALARGFDVPELPAALGFGIDTLAIVVGLLVRAGIAWILCLNVVAVLAFIDFRELVLSGSAVAGLFLALDTLALIGIARHRDWFERDRSARPRDGRPHPKPDTAGDPRPGRG